MSRQSSFGSSGSLFSTVTGKKNDRLGMQATVTRTFSGTLARTKSVGTLTRCQSRGSVASHQFIFKDDSQANTHDDFDTERSNSVWPAESNRGSEDSMSATNELASYKKRNISSSDVFNTKRAKKMDSSTNVISKNLLYTKLTKGVGPIRSSTTLKSSDSPNSNNRFRPSAAVRSKLASYSHTALVMR